MNRTLITICIALALCARALASDSLTVATVDSIETPVFFDEALAALVMLGFAKSASEKVLRKIFKEEPSVGVEDAIRTALKQL